MIEGKEISRTRCQQIAERALRKLRVLLEDDPEVIEYWIDNPSYDFRTMEKTRIDLDELDMREEDL
jgi:hypothetical protein